MANILDPIEIKNTTVKNRVVFPPVVIFAAGRDGKVTKEHVAHYRRRAAGGSGLIIVEATCIAPKGRLRDSQLGIWDEGQLEGLGAIARACGDEGAMTLIQIHHAGLKSPSDINPDRASASDYRDEERSARAMTGGEIRETRDAFVSAAVRAWKAGFNGVELHGAHGFLLSQFASRVVNTRTDRYGGDVAGRLRFAGEIISGIRSEVPDKDFIIGYRMGYNEPELKDGIDIASTLENQGVDLLHVSNGFGGVPPSGITVPEVPPGFPGNATVWGGTEVRKHVGIPVIVVNGIRTHDQAAWFLDGRADMVALAKGLLVDPDWTAKAGTGEEIVSCLDCKPRCKWFEDYKTCPRFDEAWLSM